MNKEISEKEFIEKVTELCDENKFLNVSLYEDPYNEYHIIKNIYDRILFYSEKGYLSFSPLGDHNNRNEIRVKIQSKGKFYTTFYMGDESYEYQDDDFGVRIDNN